MISYTISVERLRVLQKGLAQNEDAVLDKTCKGRWFWNFDIVMPRVTPLKKTYWNVGIRLMQNDFQELLLTVPVRDSKVKQ